eukprot:4940504-Amphidinium_carterae.1
MGNSDVLREETASMATSLLPLFVSQLTSQLTHVRCLAHHTRPAQVGSATGCGKAEGSLAVQDWFMQTNLSHVRTNQTPKEVGERSLCTRVGRTSMRAAHQARRHTKNR